MTDWGVPDWQDAAHYHEELTDFQWWWEFTRRRPDYRALWEGTSPPNYRELRLTFEMSTMLDPRESFSDWSLRHRHYPRTMGANASAIRTTDDLAKLEEEAGTYWVSFNLAQPLKSQLSKAEALLKDAQLSFRGCQKRKPERGNWPFYLRVLDARDVGASWSSIGETLWPGDGGNTERARSHHQAAVQLRDHFPTETL